MLSYYDMVLRITDKSGRDLHWFFQTTFYWKYMYHSDVSNDIMLFVQQKVVPQYVKDFFDEMQRRIDSEVN